MTANENQFPKMVLDKETSTRITMMRFILMVFVVFIHNNVFPLPGMPSAAPIPGYFHIVRLLIAESFGSCVVPLFLFISAYLLYAKNEPYTVMLRKKTRTIFVPYVLWTFIAIGSVLLLQSIPQAKNFFMTSENNFKNFSFIDWIDVFLGRLTNRAPYPYVFQFWYLRDLMLMLLISPIIKKLVDTIPICFFTLVLAWWFHFPYGQVSSAILFFSLGYYAVSKNFTAASLNRIKFRDICILFTVLAIANVALQCISYTKPSDVISAFANSVRAFTIFSGCIFVLKLSGFWAKNKKAEPVLRYLSNFSFWLYAIHAPVLLFLLRIVTMQLIPQGGAGIFIPYFGLVILCVLVALISGIALKKVAPKLYALLTGGR